VPVRLRKEIQEMLRRLILLLLPLSLGAQVWPEAWREHKRVKAEPVAVADQALFNEYGGEQAETASYTGPAGKFRATAWRLKDSTGALGWYQAMRPENGVPVRGNPLACVTPGAYWLAQKNYVIEIEGWRPTERELDSLLALLPKVRSGGGLPVFASYLPEKDRIRNSERFITGLTSLERFEKRIPGIQVGFEDSAEIALARYRTAGTETNLALINYPTNQLARIKADAFNKNPEWTVKRSGPFVAVALAPPGPAPQALLDQVNYSATAMWDQATKPPPMPNVGGMLVAIFELTGVLLLICLGGGLLFATLWLYMRRRQAMLTGSESPFTSLHISGD